MTVVQDDRDRVAEVPLNRASSLKEPELSRYLQETPFCDYKHPVIQDTMQEVIGDCGNEEEKARRVFYYARDHIRFALMGSGIATKASMTAKIGYGDCGTKTNFHIALLRAVGIPARMRGIMAEISVLKGMIPGFLYFMVEKAKEDFHFWPECYLRGKWIACEGLFDQELYDGALREGLLTKELIPSIDWDGKSRLVLLEPWKTEDFGNKPSWDDWYIDFKKRMATPRVIDRLMELTIAPSCRRQTDRIRRRRQFI